jgi:hypothetical protein
MTNEEKAKTLVDGLGIIYTDCNRVTIKKLLIKMAQWKDEQEVEFLQSLMFQASTQQALNIIINNRIKLLKGE